MRWQLSGVLVWIGLAVGSATAQCVLEEEQRLAFGSLGIFDFVGVSMDVEGHRMVIGGTYHDFTGAAFVFRHNSRRWILEQELKSADGTTAQEFGRAVGFDGDSVLVGAPTDDEHGADAGAAYVFRYQGGAWVEEQKIVPADARAGQFFGGSVAISGDRMVVGATLDDQGASLAGAAYLFEFDGNRWNQSRKLIPSDTAFDQVFGAAVDIEGDRALVTAFERDSSGSVYLFEFDGNQFIEKQKMKAQDAAFGDLFGCSVALDDDRILIGAKLEDQKGSEAGAAYVFEHNGLRFRQITKLYAHDAQSGGQFGCAVSLDGDRGVVGSLGDNAGGPTSGAAYVFRFDGSSWMQQSKLVASDGGPARWLGSSVAIQGTRVMSGAMFAYPGGAAYCHEVGEFGLDIRPSVLQLGDLVQFNSCAGNPGAPVVTFVTAVGGVSSFRQVPIATVFDSTGAFSTITRIHDVPDNVPVDIEFLSFSMDANGALIHSNSELIRVQ